MLQLQAREEAKLLDLLLKLTEILDSFDQLTKVAMICDLLYPPEEQVHKELFKVVEKTARHLRGLPSIHQGDQGDQGAAPVPHRRGNCTHGPCDYSCAHSCHGPEGEPGQVGAD